LDSRDLIDFPARFDRFIWFGFVRFERFDLGDLFDRFLRGRITRFWAAFFWQRLQPFFGFVFFIF